MKPRRVSPARALAACLALPILSMPALAQERPPQERTPPGTPLHLAALQGDLETIHRHVAAGSDLDQRDAWGSTPLTAATTFGHAAAVQLLLEAGADPVLGNAEGSTPLHIAAFLGRREVVETLLAHGVAPWILNDDGATAFDMAAVPAEVDRSILDQLRAGLAPMGFELDDAGVESGRAAARELLRSATDAAPPVEYRPAPEGDWPRSTPEAEGLDPRAVARLYAEARELTAIRSVLVVRNGRLVAEGYFNEGGLHEPTLLQSVTKSIVSALTGIALDRGCLESLDQPILDLFPEQASRIRDPRKREITLRHLLQMRAGYGWEGSDPERWAGLVGRDLIPLLVDFPLERDPGSGFDYSNVTSHLLGVTVARACDTDLLDFASEYLFDPLGVRPGSWREDPRGYRYGYGELHLTARDAARFGLLYLNGGVHDGRQLVPAEWVRSSLAAYSTDINTAGLRDSGVGRYFREVAYGFQWWSGRVGDHRFDFAWGHGGQMIVLLHDLDMMVVVTSDPFYRAVREDHEAWTHEQANFNLVGRFLHALPPATERRP